MLKYKTYKLVKPSSAIGNLISSKNGSIFHDVELNKIIEKNFNSELYYLVDNPINPQHAAVVHITKNKFRLKKYNIRPLFDMPYAGFIGNKEVDFNAFSIGFFESISYAGFPYSKSIKEEKNVSKGETAMIDLTLSEDDIFNNVIHSKRRNMIRKAISEGITVKSYFSVEGLKLFWPLLNELHKKLGYTKLAYNYYNEILETFAHKKQAFILIAFKNDLPVSGVFILGNQNFMHYYKGASSFEAKNEGQGELLQWEAIKLSKSLGTKMYDLCNLSKDKLPEIYRFKTGISRDIFNFQMYTRSAFGYRFSTRIIKKL